MMWTILTHLGAYALGMVMGGMVMAVLAGSRRDRNRRPGAVEIDWGLPL